MSFQVATPQAWINHQNGTFESAPLLNADQSYPGLTGGVMSISNTDSFEGSSSLLTTLGSASNQNGSVSTSFGFSLNPGFFYEFDNRYTYNARLKVSTRPSFTNGDQINLYLVTNGNVVFPLGDISNYLDSWVEINWQLIWGLSNSNAVFGLYLQWDSTQTNNPIPTDGMEIFFDAATVLEEEPVQPACDLAFGSPSHTKTDETVDSGDDGTITINATSSFTIQYSLDNINYQSSNVFTGLAPGTYTIYAQDTNPLGCQISEANVVILEFDGGPVDPPQPPQPGPLTIDCEPVNSYNFVTWFNAVGSSGFDSIICENEYWDYANAYEREEKLRQHFWVVVPGEDFSFYVNFNSPINDPSFSSYRVALAQYSSIVPGFEDLGTLNQDVLDNGTDYNIYSTLNITGITAGRYYLVIYNSVSNEVKFVSNQFEVIQANQQPDRFTNRIQYRNSNSIYNYRYSILTEFVNQIRLRLYLIDEQPEGNVEQYREASTGRLRNVNFELDIALTFEAYYFDKISHRALFVFSVHDSIVINGRTVILAELPTPTFDPLKRVNKATIRFYDQNFSTCNRFGKINPIQIVGSDDDLLLGDDGGFIKI